MYKAIIDFPKYNKNGVLVPGYLSINFMSERFSDISQEIFLILANAMRPSFGLLHSFSDEEIASVSRPILRDFELGVW
jgi:hypothetical protein